MKRILLLSGKGGTGKTTVSSALIRLSQAKAVADCDVDAPNLHLVLQEKEKAQVSAQTCAQVSEFFGGEKAAVDPALCTSCGRCEQLCRFDAIHLVENTAVVNLYSCEGCGVCSHVCPAGAVRLLPDVAGIKELYTGDRVFSTATLKMGRGNSGKLVTEVKKAMLKAAPPCELAIVDGSPGIGCPVIASVNGMDLVLVVAEPSGSGISDLKRLCATAATLQVQLAVCVNKYDVSPQHTERIETFCRQQGIAFVGKIPFDPMAVRAVNEGTTVVDIDCLAGRAVREIFAKLTALLAERSI